tara:strand:- start:2397 stop:2672 length:276 start_codon:yes stop_codon:yes gene_type:complete
MASPNDIPKIQSNLNINQSVATESSKINKDRKENPNEQSGHEKEKAEKDSIELSQEAKIKLNNNNNSLTNTSENNFEEMDDIRGQNIDFKA